MLPQLQVICICARAHALRLTQMGAGGSLNRLAAFVTLLCGKWRWETSCGHPSGETRLPRALARCQRTLRGTTPGQGTPRITGTASETGESWERNILVPSTSSLPMLNAQPRTTSDLSGCRTVTQQHDKLTRASVCRWCYLLTKRLRAVKGTQENAQQEQLSVVQSAF